MKKVLYTRTNNQSHWVGDGFPVRTIFSYHDIAKEISPFLLMDYAGPMEFTPSHHRRGVGSHPHRGFETVTIVYAGEVEHRDSAGGGGVIQSGDVQWMTAASGLVHEEKHGVNFTRDGGLFEMVQLWVNLPQKDKMTSPRYQGIKSENIPQMNWPQGGSLRVIAGNYDQLQGPALTFTPIHLWDIRLNSNVEITLKVPPQQTSLIFLLSGKVTVNSTHTLNAAELAVLEKDGDEIRLSAQEDSKVLFLGGQPIPEPIVGHGPFVMNTKEEILQAFQDFEAGKMGVLTRIEGSD